MPYQDPESDLHVVEIKIRLKPVDGALARVIYATSASVLVASHFNLMSY